MIYRPKVVAHSHVPKLTATCTIRYLDPVCQGSLTSIHHPVPLNCPNSRKVGPQFRTNHKSARVHQSHEVAVSTVATTKAPKDSPASTHIPRHQPQMAPFLHCRHPAPLPLLQQPGRMLSWRHAVAGVGAGALADFAASPFLSLTTGGEIDSSMRIRMSSRSSRISHSALRARTLGIRSGLWFKAQSIVMGDAGSWLVLQEPHSSEYLPWCCRK